jgi:pyrroline-5-carboxylate reductase
MADPRRVAIVGGGNLGVCIARGLVSSGRFAPPDVSVTRRRPELLESLAAEGFVVGADNGAAAREADVVLLCVQPQQLDAVLQELVVDVLAERHIVISTVSGVSIAEMRRFLGDRVPVLRAMPNIGIAIGESMTCLAGDEASAGSVEVARDMFAGLGRAMLIQEEQMVPATALCACGIAFFLRAIRAASQGGIEIGFHADEALALAAQTAKGAADLLLSFGNHPEIEIDKVTTPKGCTIYGLNEMENRGFSSALIRGIITASEKAGELYPHTSGS